MKVLSSKGILFASVTALVMIASSGYSQNIYSCERNYGKIGRLYSASNGNTYFRLVGGQNGMNPQNGYYWIPASCPNCDEMREILRMATENRLIVQARTASTLSENGTAMVYYLVIDYPPNPVPSPWNTAATTIGPPLY